MAAENTATSQFFICVDNEPGLDGNYAAFGEVIDGYDVVEAISLVETHSEGSHDDVPVEDVIIESVTRQ
jgi:peptidyl-prolyl cis-trans isomerase B (cyclophilin B)